MKLLESFENSICVFIIYGDRPYGVIKIDIFIYIRFGGYIRGNVQIIKLKLYLHQKTATYKFYIKLTYILVTTLIIYNSSYGAAIIRNRVFKFKVLAASKPKVSLTVIRIKY